MATNRPTVQSFARLADNHDFNRVLDHLRELYQEAVETGAVATDMILVGRAQGKQQVLSDLLKLARDANEILKRHPQ